MGMCICVYIYNLFFFFFTKYLFESFIQQFYVQSNEPAFIRDIKLKILANIATDVNIHGLLNELQVYIYIYKNYICIYKTMTSFI